MSISLVVFSSVRCVVIAYNIRIRETNRICFLLSSVGVCVEMGPRQCLGRMDDGTSGSLDSKQSLVHFGSKSSEESQVGHFI